MVSGTGADANIEAFGEVFSRHGFRDTLKTDNGPPLNGMESHLLEQYFCWASIKHTTIVSGEDPESNGLVRHL